MYIILVSDTSNQQKSDTCIVFGASLYLAAKWFNYKGELT